MELLVILILVIAASAIGTVTGFGLSTVMIPVLALFYPVPETLLFVGVVHWCNDLWKLVLFREGIRWKLILEFGLPGIVATVIGAHLLLAIPGTALERVLGVFLIGYVAFLFAKSAFKIRQSPAAAVTGGALSGFFAGVFGMGGAIRRCSYPHSICPKRSTWLRPARSPLRSTRPGWPPISPKAPGSTLCFSGA